MFIYIGDAHVLPGDNLSRFSLAAKLVNTYKPKAVFMDGDLWDMPSLCRQATLREVEGLRVRKEIQAGHDAISLFEDSLKVRPRLWLQESNHMHRLERLVAADPKWEGMFGYMESFMRPGWKAESYNAGHPGVTKECNFEVAHYFTIGGREAGGKYPTQRILAERRVNNAFAHTHLRGISTFTNGNGARTRSINAGCFVSDNFRRNAPYAADHKRHWWQGVVVVGDDWEDWWSLNRLKKAFT